MNRDDLKIQFRGIHYTGKSHVLQYRIDPDDERNTYIKTKKYLFGLMESSEADIKSEIIPWINNLENKNGDDKTIGIIRWEE